MKQFWLIWVLLFGCLGTYAQQTITIKGRVQDESGKALVGVTILEKGSKRNTASKEDGRFSIAAPANGVLVFTYVGYKTQERQIDNRTTLNISLQTEDNSLDEVVVIGYGTQKRKDLTGAVSSVKGEELAKVPVQNVAQALQGRLSGVQVSTNDGTPGQNPSIKIRGGTSITQSNEPLYVVDGVPQTDGLAFLDPMDIESIDVLKDASATAIYGARGANGVVLVTTKVTKAGKMRINYDGYVGVKKFNANLPLLNSYEYLKLQWERTGTDQVKKDLFLNRYGTYDSLQYYYGNKPGINWQDEIFGGSPVSQYHKLSMNGGSKDTKFNVFYSRNDDKGIMINSGALKNIAKLTLNHKLGDKVTLNAIVNYSNQKITGLGTNEGGNTRLSFLQTVLRYRPVNGRNDSDADLIDAERDPYDPAPEAPTFQSPIIALESQRREQLIKTLNASATLQYNITKKLIYRGLVSYTENGNKSKQFTDSRSVTAIRAGGPFGSINDIQTNRFNYSNTLSYSDTYLDHHKVDFTLGQEYIRNYMESFGSGAINFPQVNHGWNDLSMGTVANFPTSHAEEDMLLSFFGRLNYGFKDKYLLTATLRADGSSKFAPESRWGYFPSVAGAWRIVNERFMKAVPAVSDLKLRVSYGKSGNNRIANYAFLGIFNSGFYPLNRQMTPTAYQSNLPNPKLKWEANQATNIGLDFGLFNQRLTLTTEWYNNRSKDLLFNTRIPASSGYTTQFQNIGTTSSKGLEFTLNTVNVKNNNFNWSTNVNIAFPKTKVLGLSNDEKTMVTNSYTTSNDYILEVGRPVGIMYGYLADGLYTVDDFDFNASNNTYSLKTGVVKDNVTVQPGFQKFKDISGPNGAPDGIINDYDRTYIGNANPRYTGGIANTFSYKGIDLSVFLNFVVGNDVYNANTLANMVNNDYYNTFGFMADRFTTIDAAGNNIMNNPEQLAALNQGKTVASYTGYSTGRLFDRVIENGSFLRINTISLGYTLPKKLLNKAKIANARIYVTAYNLHVFTKYSGYDPEVSVINNAITPAVDFSAYPKAKSFVVGVNLSL
ncbi:TonB-dependent receptor [Sphingobacterium sp. 18053]|uniref:SusC/RagA family TonB-linked outer membrane protein n=1 Tax=Sphingobacterium sp. 18053 TaxID=2681401 RepID=UPI00135C9FF1|nr:TonB-dependent receptor [Sphingobacterium sp. 18053]